MADYIDNNFILLHIQYITIQYWVMVTYRL